MPHAAHSTHTVRKDKVIEIGSMARESLPSYRFDQSLYSTPIINLKLSTG
jgi:hypothetical protein